MITSVDSKGTDKVTRYGWITRNEPGDMKYVPKHSLKVDHAYQRPMNDDKRRKIAANFNYAAFGCLICAKRPDGSLWVIDGQHRLGAAMSRGDVESVPCIIFDLDGNISDEAKDFLASNKERKPLSGFQTFKAMLASGDIIALKMKEMADGVGLSFSDNGIRCVQTVYRCTKNDERAMRSVWPIIVNLCKMAGVAIDNRFVDGMHWCESHLIYSQGNPHSLATTKNTQKLFDAGAKAILRSIGDAASYYNRGGATVFADGVLNIVNHKRHKKLMLRGGVRKATGVV